jgi:hypothetical protein
MEIHWHSNQITAETELDDRGQLRTEDKQREKGREGCAAQSDEDETRVGV